MLQCITAITAFHSGTAPEYRDRGEGAQIDLTLIFGSEDQKKSLQPGPLPSFGAQVSRRVAWRNLMVRISLLAHKCRGKDKKMSGATS